MFLGYITYILYYIVEIIRKSALVVVIGKYSIGMYQLVVLSESFEAMTVRYLDFLLVSFISMGLSSFMWMSSSNQLYDISAKNHVKLDI